MKLNYQGNSMGVKWRKTASKNGVRIIVICEKNINLTFILHHTQKVIQNGSSN